jgi:hypothetical protein
MQSIDRKAFLSLAVAMHSAGCVIESGAQAPTPIVQSQPTQATVTQQQQTVVVANTTGPTQECSGWTPAGECNQWAPRQEVAVMAPTQECTGWTPTGECNQWAPRGE